MAQGGGQLAGFVERDELALQVGGLLEVEHRRLATGDHDGIERDVFAVRDAAIAGLGVAHLPLVIATAAVQAGQLQAVLPDWSPPAVPVHAVFASARYLTPKVRAFIDLAVEAMRGDAA